MSIYFKEIESYIKKRAGIRITYNAYKGSALQFDNTRLSKIKRKTINSFIQHLKSNEDNNKELINILVKEREFRDILNQIKGIIYD